MTEASLSNEGNKPWAEPETSKLVTTSGVSKVDNATF